MAVTKIISKVDTKTGWIEVDNKDFHDFYVIAIKDKKSAVDTVDADNVVKLRFEMGIDSGIPNKPLTTQYFTLNFNEVSSSDEETNKITAFTKFVNCSSKFYIKFVSFFDGKQEIKEGKSSISININTVK